MFAAAFLYNGKLPCGDEKRLMTVHKEHCACTACIGNT